MAPDKLALLRSLEIGERVAEEEVEKLEKYFVETDQWRQMEAGKVDVVYGPKGSGKSALYTLLNKRENEFFDRGILLAAGENVRGATVFRSVVSAPPPSELAFQYLWKLYCLTLIANTLRSYDVRDGNATALISSLSEVGLLPTSTGLPAIFKAVTSYLKSWLNRDAKSVAYELTIDAATGAPSVSRKVEFAAKTEQQSLDDIPVDELLEMADTALQGAGLKLWLLFDRLDVAFADSPELERNALRALFRAYNDIKAFSNISLKIFVRDDIWRRITEGGFTEASHITKSLTIAWSTESLLNLIVMRLLSNESIVKYCGVDPDAIRSDYDAQKALFYSLAPDKIDSGKNPQTFEWMVSRTTDGTGYPAPRELIHLLGAVRKLQILRFERGAADVEDTQIFERAPFKEALIEVSKVRYEQTLLAEYPGLREYLNQLEGEKCEQTTDSLSKLWGIPIEESFRIAKRLSEVGFFTTIGDKANPSFWAAFLYRPALNLVQGKADPA
ncbi:hypothetical protein JAK25_03945 [Stenotrophomonas maltophilia]|uniref:P-loop ATPase, Sll1717 family n=1 Tax=Stenotrophomonas maltophilia TaxID=40324 RepID=UPI0021CAA833|nr:hypothetical protein [Stenotrophomonas maltophilia]MCU1203036.1 hypothetical protein [Stenotrophomonas maltophilia]